jgi:hypothetical protein
MMTEMEAMNYEIQRATLIEMLVAVLDATDETVAEQYKFAATSYMQGLPISTVKYCVQEAQRLVHQGVCSE